MSVALASFGLARPVTSILLSHGSAVAAALGAAAGGASWLPAWASASRTTEHA